jgi:hypothetical protein
VWNVRTGRLVHNAKTPIGEIDFWDSLSPDGRYAYVAVLEGGS